MVVYANDKPVVNLRLEGFWFKLHHIAVVLHKTKIHLLQHRFQEHELRTQVLGGIDEQQVKKRIPKNRNEQIPAQNRIENLVNRTGICVNRESDQSGQPSGTTFRYRNLGKS